MFLSANSKSSKKTKLKPLSIHLLVTESPEVRPIPYSLVCSKAPRLSENPHKANGEDIRSLSNFHFKLKPLELFQSLTLCLKQPVFPNLPWKYEFGITLSRCFKAHRVAKENEKCPCSRKAKKVRSMYHKLPQGRGSLHKQIFLTLLWQSQTGANCRTLLSPE